MRPRKKGEESRPFFMRITRKKEGLSNFISATIRRKERDCPLWQKKGG